MTHLPPHTSFQAESVAEQIDRAIEAQETEHPLTKRNAKEWAKVVELLELRLRTIRMRIARV